MLILDSGIKVIIKLWGKVNGDLIISDILFQLIDHQKYFLIW